MQRFKLLIAYDGTDYHGWQVQPDKATVAGVLQARFKKVFGHEIHLTGASRTDAGVHALGQVATLNTDIVIDPQKLCSAWNGRLPADIRIRAATCVPDEFHPQRNVATKIYWYHIFTERPLPGFARYGSWYRFPIDMHKLQAALQLFVGTHDFRSFCTGDEQESTVRSVTAIRVIPLIHYRAYRIEVVGPGFLRYMIRRMVGAALYVAAHPQMSVTEIATVLAARNPLHTLPSAPAQGLVLRKIVYQE